MAPFDEPQHRTGEVGIQAKDVTQQQLDEDMKTCRNDTGITDWLTQAEHLYLLVRYHTDLVGAAECLVAEGFNVPPATTLETFLETNGANWNPYSGLGDNVGLLKTCPSPIRAEPLN